MVVVAAVVAVVAAVTVAVAVAVDVFCCCCCCKFGKLYCKQQRNDMIPVFAKHLFLSACLFVTLHSSTPISAMLAAVGVRLLQTLAATATILQKTCSGFHSLGRLLL